MKMVDYIEDMIVNDERALRRGEDDEDVFEVNGIAPWKLRAVFDGRFGLGWLRRLAGAEPLWRLVAEKFEYAEEQLAALTLLWLVKEYGWTRWPRDVLEKLVPRSDERLRKLLEPLILALDENLRREKRWERRQRLLERALEKLGGMEKLLQLAEDYNKGIPIRELKIRYGLRDNEELYALLEYAERLGLLMFRRRRSARRRVGSELRRRILELYKKYCNYKRVAEELGMPYSTVRYHVRRAGVSCS